MGDFNQRVGTGVGVGLTPPSENSVAAILQAILNEPKAPDYVPKEPEPVGKAQGTLAIIGDLLTAIGANKAAAGGTRLPRSNVFGSLKERRQQEADKANRLGFAQDQQSRQEQQRRQGLQLQVAQAKEEQARRAQELKDRQDFQERMQNDAQAAAAEMARLDREFRTKIAELRTSPVDQKVALQEKQRGSDFLVGIMSMAAKGELGQTEQEVRKNFTAQLDAAGLDDKSREKALIFLEAHIIKPFKKADVEKRIEQDFQQKSSGLGVPSTNQFAGGALDPRALINQLMRSGVLPGG